MQAVCDIPIARITGCVSSLNICSTTLYLFFVRCRHVYSGAPGLGAPWNRPIVPLFSTSRSYFRLGTRIIPLEFVLAAPVAYQVIPKPGIGQFREFEPRRVHIRINLLGLFLVHKLTRGKRESVS